MKKAAFTLGLLAALYCIPSQAAEPLKITVTTSGDSYKGPPILYLTVNGAIVASQPVTASHANGAWETLTFTTPAPASLEALGVAFFNDLYTPKVGDRNLYIKSITVNGATFLPKDAVYKTIYNGIRPSNGVMEQDANLIWAGWPITQALQKVVGQCGPVNNTAVTAEPTAGLCSAGLASAVTGNDPWNWSCAGSNGGSTAACATTATKILTDNQAYTSGPYTGYLAPWGKGSYVQGKDYTESLEVLPASFPNHSVIKWSWPNTPPTKSGVYNYLAIDYGNYNNSTYPTPITPKQVSKISALSETHNFTLSSAATGFDIIDDLFLTPAANNQNTHLFEVEVFLHTPKYAAEYVQSSTPIGTVVVSGITWTVAIDKKAAAPDILFMPTNQADIPSGTIDLKAMFNYLVTKKVLTGSEWFNGLAFGVEVRQDSGSTVINSLSVAYK